MKYNYRFLASLVLALPLAGGGTCVYAEKAQELSPAAETRALMDTVPPSPESQVSFKNHRDYPFNRWAFRNMSAPMNGLMLAREGEISTISGEHQAKIADFTFQDTQGKTATFGEVFPKAYADGVVVLKNGKRVYEQYYEGMGEHDLHIWYSMTKSLVSAAFGILVEEGKVDLSQSPAQYIPELRGSGFERVTIQNVLDHRSAIGFKESYTDLKSDFALYYAPALNMAYIPGGRDAQAGKVDIYGVHDFLGKFVRPDEQLKPGHMFDYNSSNADVLGWLVARISGMPLREYLQQKIWSKLGVEHDAYIVVDRAYQAVATGGMNSSLRDAVRFGQLIADNGLANGVQILPKAWLQKQLAYAKEDKQAFSRNEKYKNDPWVSYKNMWWVLNPEKGEFAAVGIHGQIIYINRAANVTAAVFSSQPGASAAGYAPFHDKLKALRELAKTL